MKKGLFNKFLMVALLAGADLLSKACALAWIPPLRGSSYPFGGIPIFNGLGVSFSLNAVPNTGMAWGFFPGHPSLLLAFRMCAIAVFCFLLGKSHFSRRAVLPLQWIAAGALGNVFDMICYGYVVDFLHFRFFGWSFPIFNLADSLITLGALLLFFSPKKVFREKKL